MKVVNNSLFAAHPLRRCSPILTMLASPRRPIVAFELEREVKTFDREFAALMASSPGKHVLIREDAVIGVYDTHEEAIEAGYEKFGLTPFMVSEIAPPRFQYWDAKNASMPHLTLPISFEGCVVRLNVGVSKTHEDKLRNTNQPVPPAETVDALIDTGSNSTFSMNQF